MKSILTLLVFLTLFSNFSNAQTYVNASASGKNSGTSWQDAYITLHDALENYDENDEIWVATGTYTPENPSLWSDTIKQTFYLHQDVKLYGGFNGTETTLDQRDPLANVTILSGDINGDDVADDFDNSKSDNANNVVYIEAAISTATIIDGFSIIGGYADGNSISDFYSQNGGGVWSFGSPLISNCRFTQNYAVNAAGGLAIADTTSTESIVENCIFERNRSVQGGALVIQSISIIPTNLVQISNCQFIDNIADLSGGAFGMGNSLVELTNCQFTGNSSQNAGGAIIYINIQGGDNELTVIDCIFDNNISNHGGAFYHESNGFGNDKLVFTNCEFTNNQAVKSPDYSYPDAGALGFQYIGDNPTNDTIIISDCRFQGNSTERNGGGLAFFNGFGTDNYFEISNTQFIENTSFEDGGSCYISNYGANNSEFKLIDSNFEGNISENVGAGVQYSNFSGTGHNMTLSGCKFINNQSGLFGGGFREQSAIANGDLIVENCLFEGNTAIVDGGGLEVARLNQGNGDITIRNTDFLSNTSGNEGAGMNFYVQDEAGGNLLIEETLFSGNINDATGNAEEGAGGFSLINFGNGIAEVNIQSSIFENNSSADGSGGIQLFKEGTTIDVVNIENCLLNNNTGGTYASGIGSLGAIEINIINSTITDNNTDAIVVADSDLKIQNTILHNPGLNNLLNTNTLVTSLGGNLIGDTSMDAYLTSSDQSSTDPLFETGTYQLSQNSPAVDAGFLPDEVSDFDLAGNDRIQGGCIDIGAYESVYDAGQSCVNHTKEVIQDNSVLELSPNPVSHDLQIHLDNEWSSQLHVQIVNTLGQIVESTSYEKHETMFDKKIELPLLPKGIYRLLISNGEEMVVQSFVKN